MKKIRFINQILEDRDFTTKITIYFSTKTAGEDFDTYENNYTYTNLNPLTIKGIVTDISPEALVWKSYGLKEIGAKEVVCKSKYAEWFRIANKIVIDGDEFEVYKEGVGNRVIIQKRLYNLIRVVLQKRT